MKILCLITDAFGGHGGISKFNRDLLSALCSYPGVDEVVAVPRIMPHPCGTLPPKLRYVTEGVDSKVKFIISILSVLLQRHHFDLILCGHINLVPLSWFCRMVTGVPLVLIVHGVDAWQPTRSRVTNYFVKKIDVLVSVSEYTKKRFLNWTGLRDIKFFIQPNSVDPSLFFPATKNEKLIDRYGLKEKIVLLTLGRLDSLERAKGFDEVLEVLPQLANEFPNIVYLIAGAGRDRNRLEQKVKSLGVDHLVVFTGFVAEDEKADHYRIADVYVMPSRGEGFGIVLLEAMACGIPTIASKVDGSREALRDGLLGVLVDPDKPEELLDGIRQALKMPRKIPAGLEYFSDKNFQGRIHQLLDSLAGSHH